MRPNNLALILLLAGSIAATLSTQAQIPQARQRISIDDGWRFFRYTDTQTPDSLIYDQRPRVTDRNDNKVADTRASDSATGAATGNVLKPWILPSANDFIKDPSQRHARPAAGSAHPHAAAPSSAALADPGSDFPFVKPDFDDRGWQPVNLPHDWAIQGPFYTAHDAIVGGGMGRLPVQGVAWYRRKLDIPASDAGRSIYLYIDGAMSYAMVWLNGHLVGGWPYGYASFRLDLTPYVKPGGVNQLAIRLDNPPNSSRWYPGAGLYRNVWLEKVNPVHVAQWGTFVRTKNVSPASATIDLTVKIENASKKSQKLSISTDIYAIDTKLEAVGKKITSLPTATLTTAPYSKQQIENTTTINDPRLWGPPPAQQPNLYVAITRVYAGGKRIDEYQTRFGIRDVQFDPLRGIIVNGQPVRIQGVNQHHDLGALGAAFNTCAAERQLEALREMGCNAIRLAHNPPAPELLDLTDRMGFLVIDEIFDCWYRGKTPLDFHLIFADWHEADLRSLIRRDKNHPSVIEWSFGNEVGEQYTGEPGAAVAKELHDIVRDEDDSRPATASMNYAKPGMPFPKIMDVVSLNYQGEGIRDAPAYAHLKGIGTPPLYPAFQKQFPDKLIQSTETASTLGSRGTYVFPVTKENSAPVSDSTGGGGDPTGKFVSAYDLYTAAFGASPDKVFSAQDHHPFVAGEFVWSGWDYLGEPTPYYSARSSYSGIIDLAGFRKDRFYLYQARWRPGLPMAHILPHWTWPGREGQITPVHVYTSGDEAELFLNGRSLGRKKKGQFEYRLRWDSVRYEPGELRVVAYKRGKPWAADAVRTAGPPAQLQLAVDRPAIQTGMPAIPAHRPAIPADSATIFADGNDLSFITVRVLDSQGTLVPTADNKIIFEVTGPGEIVATDNGNPADMTAFSSHRRAAFSGLALAIIRRTHPKGTIVIKATAEGLAPAAIPLQSGSIPATSPRTYRNVFAEAGYRPADIDAKIDSVYRDLFEGPHKIYFEVGDSMGYVSDLKNHDARTEGLSYGMMIAVQLDKKDVFDRIWRWSKKYLQHPDGPREGYFAWSINPATLKKNSEGTASDGELYFITDLLFAANRWGNNTGIDYYREARRILDAMWNKDGSGGIYNLINKAHKLITFTPEGNNYNWTDPSYNLPAFFEVWAMYAKDGHEQFYRDCADSARTFLHRACDPVTGLTTDYAEFSGAPHPTSWMPAAFRYDSWRVPMNIAMDYCWFGKDTGWQRQYAKKIQAFLLSRGIDSFADQFNVDGSRPDFILAAGGVRKLRHSLGLVAAAAATTLINNTDDFAFVHALWNAKLEPYADGYFDPYYDGLLYLFSLMHLSGNYRLIQPAIPGSATN